LVAEDIKIGVNDEISSRNDENAVSRSKPPIFVDEDDRKTTPLGRIRARWSKDRGKSHPIRTRGRRSGREAWPRGTSPLNGGGLLRGGVIDHSHLLFGTRGTTQAHDPGLATSKPQSPTCQDTSQNSMEF
jgi:hypothetical protein